jgi:hypothetical protein
MKRLLVAALAAAALVPFGQAAHASGTTYKGGCGFDTLNDTTPGGQLGGQDVWNGGVYLAVVATDAAGTPTGGAVTASCELKVNGVSQGTVLGPKAGTGAVADAGTVQFTAAVTDIVSLCAHVTTASGTEVTCNDATTTQIVPQPVIDAINLVLDTFAELTKDTDGPTCMVLINLAPVVNATTSVTTLSMDLDDCDIWLAGARQIDFVPYGD